MLQNVCGKKSHRWWDWSHRGTKCYKMSLWEKILLFIMPPPHPPARAPRLRPRGTGNHSKLHISASPPKLQNPPPPAWSCCSQLPLSGQQSPSKLHRQTQSPLIAMPTSPSPHTHARKSQPNRASSPLQRYPAHRRGSSEAVSGLGGRRAKKPPSLRLATAPSGALAEPPKRGKVRLAPHAQRCA